MFSITLRRTRDAAGHRQQSPAGFQQETWAANGAWKQRSDESTRIKQEASQIQGPAGADQGVDGRQGVAPARYRIGLDADRKSNASTQA
jgi:hypothetical protein